MQLLEAMAEVVAERGLRATSAAAVTERALVSRDRFMQRFDSVEPSSC
jgi:AcrR family transcriptional regulator